LYVENQKKKICERVLKFLILWVQKFPYDFLFAQLRKGLLDFIDFISKHKNGDLEVFYKTLKSQFSKLQETTLLQSGIFFFPQIQIVH